MQIEIKKYSKRQILGWLESFPYRPQKIEELRNGVFFCKLLKEVYPNDFTKCKIIQKPISEYQYMTNLNLMKKVLNKHGLYNNLNIYTIMASKNNLQFINWLKNLIEANQVEESRVTRRQYSSRKSQKTLTQRKSSATKINTYRLDNNKKSNFYQDYLLPPKNYTKPKSSKAYSENKSQCQSEDSLQLLRQRALIQNIAQFNKIINKIRQITINTPTTLSLLDFKQAILSKIYNQ